METEEEKIGKGGKKEHYPEGINEDKISAENLGRIQLILNN